MLRAYALFLGAGTQVLTAGFTALPFMKPYLSENLNTVTMTAGWVINALVAEWMLRKPHAARHFEAPASEIHHRA